MTTEVENKETPPEVKTFEVDALPEVGKKDNSITVEMARERGWSEEEIKIGQEHKMFTEPKEDPKPEDKKPEDKKPDVEVKKADPEDFTFTFEEEKKLREAMADNPAVADKLRNSIGLYKDLKYQRQRASGIEAEKKRIEKENQELKERLSKIESKLTETPNPEEEEKPLTKKELMELMKTMREEEINSRRRTESEVSEREQKINEALKIQESHAKVTYQDYDETVGLGYKLLERDQAGQFKNEVNITTLPEHARKKAMVLLNNIKAAASRADEMSVEDYTVADMSYELGQLAKQFTSPRAEPGKEPERSPRGLTPEEEERVKKNQSRSGSSASISGSGGRRVLSVDEVTIDDLNSMDSKTFEAFRNKHPDKVDELMRS